jgi:DNA-binding transcriptional MerR regulator
MLKIRDFAKLAEVSMATLRYYDEIGLLKPIRVDPETGYRFYTIDQLPQMHRILAFKELGLELNQIIEILNEGVSPEALQAILRFRQAQIQQRIQAEQGQLIRIEARLRLLERSSALPAYEVVLKSITAITGVSLRLAGPDLAYLAHWVDPLDTIMQRYGISPIDHLIVLHPEQEGQQTEPIVEVVAPLDWKDANTLTVGSDGRLTHISLPAVPHMASTLHHGHPTLLLSAYHALGSWMEQHGYTIVGPRRKIRLRRGANLDDALTEIQFPVEKIDDSAAV